MPIAQRRKATTASMSSPIGGWNARDSLAEMSPLDAVQLINWFPTPSDVTLRRGYTKYSQGFAGDVNTLMTYAGTSSQKMFAAVGNKIYDVTSSTAVLVYTGLSSDKLQWINISTAGGLFLVACNGVDPVLIYDGSIWATIATTTTAQTISTITHVGAVATVTTASPHSLVTGNRVTISGATPSAYNGTYYITVTGASTFTYTMASSPASNATVVGTYTVTGITGVNSNTFVNVNLFKNRLYFTQVNSMKCWYLDVNSIGGAANQLDFGGIAGKGGYLQAMGTWTLDAGQGADDYAVFITSMGEVMVYNGTDPTNATTWSLKGVWALGQTFSRRCFFKYAGDLLLMTQDGLVPLASALQSSRLDPRVNLTDKIYYAISQAADAYSTNFGWQIIYFAKQNMLILNIPVTNGIEQYVMHTITKAWGRFTGIDANCWTVMGDDVYFGSTNFVGKFWDSFADDGNNINAQVQQAYSYFDTRGQLKRFTMVRPVFLTSNGTPGVACGVNVDFDTQNVTGQVTFNPSLGQIGVWDLGLWDVALWGGGLQVAKQWQGVTGIGYSAGMYMTVAAQGLELHWASTDYVMETGGVI